MALVVKNMLANARDMRPRFDPYSGRSPGGGHGTPFQYSCLKNPHGQGSLEGYSPWSHIESDTTQRLSTQPGLQSREWVGEGYSGLHCDPGLPAEWMWGREGWELIRGLTENVGTVWIREVRRKGVKDETQDAGR